MSDNIVTIYGEVPELVEKKSSEIVNNYLGQEKMILTTLNLICMKMI